MRSMSISPSMRMTVPPVYDAGNAAFRPLQDAGASPMIAFDANGLIPSDARCRSPQIAFGGGFTLLEVMIAMAILAISLVAVYQSQSQSISMAGSSRFLTTASLLAQSRMVEIDAADPRGVAAGNGDFGENFPDYHWQVEIGETEVAALKKIILTVTNSRMVVRNTYRLILYKVVLP
jgi:general secretion pathway protein I